MASLPVTLRHHVTRHFRPTVAGAVLSNEHVRQGRSVVQEGSEDVEFWRKIVEEERFREVLQNGQPPFSFLICFRHEEAAV